MDTSKQSPTNVPPFDINDPRYPRPKWVRDTRQELRTVRKAWIVIPIFTTIVSVGTTFLYGGINRLSGVALIILTIAAIPFLLRQVKRDIELENAICTERERKEQEQADKQAITESSET